MQIFQNAPRARHEGRFGQAQHDPAREERPTQRQRPQPVGLALTTRKAGALQEPGRRVGGRISELQTALEKIGDEEDIQQEQLLHCQNLSNLTWNDVDVGALLARIDDLTMRLKAERDARPTWQLWTTASRRRRRAPQGCRQEEQGGRERQGLAKTSKAERQTRRAGASVANLIARRRSQTKLQPGTRPLAKTSLLRVLDQVHAQVDRGLSIECASAGVSLDRVEGSIVQRFVEFNRLWPAVAGGLDATLESADDYLAKLKRLEDDNLPAYEGRFFGLLREQSDQNLTLLATKLDEERSAYPLTHGTG
jgi:uncharacterized protein YPO0396